MTTKHFVLALGLAASTLLLQQCARNPVTGKSQIVTMSEEQEIAMGKEADPQVIAQFGLYPDSAIQRYMRQKGLQLAALSHRPNIQYEFRVLNSSVINAFAIPGYVYFTRGIMAHFNNEAQFEGVLGHELGHIAARHSVIQQRNQMLGQVGILAGVILSPQFGQIANAASQGLGLLLLKNSRDDEREADRLGVEYSTKAGYDATQMAEFFNTLKRQGEQSGAEPVPNLLSTHPDPGERNQTVAQLATEWKQKTGLTNPKVNRDTYLRLIEGIIYGDDPREGFVESSVFYHPELRFQFAIPTGWQFQNTPQQVQMAPKDGGALMIFTLAQGTNLQQAASATLQQYQLQVVNSRETTINSLPALLVEGQAQQQNGGVIRSLSAFVQYNGTIYHMIGVTTAANYSSYSQYFLNSIQSFRSLTDASKLNRKPEKIRLKTVTTAGTLEQVLRNFNMPSARLNELAILNGMNLADRVPQGTLVKTIGE